VAGAGAARILRAAGRDIPGSVLDVLLTNDDGIEESRRAKQTLRARTARISTT